MIIAVFLFLSQAFNVDLVGNQPETGAHELLRYLFVSGCSEEVVDVLLNRSAGGGPVCCGGCPLEGWGSVHHFSGVVGDGRSMELMLNIS